MIDPEIFTHLWSYLEAEWPALADQVSFILSWSDAKGGLAVLAAVDTRRFELLISSKLFSAKTTAAETAGFITSDLSLRQFLLRVSEPAIENPVLVFKPQNRRTRESF